MIVVAAASGDNPRQTRLTVDVHLGDLEGGGPNESPIPPTLWPSVCVTKNTAGTSSNRSVKPKKRK
jgi:hypothetical protein